jgi:dienelactone hydrolase
MPAEEKSASVLIQQASISTTVRKRWAGSSVGNRLYGWRPPQYDFRVIRHLSLGMIAVIATVAGNLASAADDQPLAFNAKSVGGRNSGATMELWRPANAGPVPAVLVLHGCDGVSSHQRSWAARLVGWGYAAAIIDSFRPRGVNQTCMDGGQPVPKLRAQDAFNAASYLRTLPDILPDRIGVIGFSHGGSTTMFTTLASEVPANRGGRPFAAAVAYYPTCRTELQGGALATDALILAARDDDWTPSAPCVKLVATRAGQPHAPTIKVYPVVHGFDLPFSPRLYAGHTLGSNPEAAADSFVMTEAFLAARLKAK